ncbi:unnamed protein product [Trifolium pratense]|uniref:Uncharacterized protein n=1 Tax=Trifolium pratense TaxID=57577 RepID=A0ACB0JX96_TRIPR|nr:unnamed protein product [Trifolium pratense]
MYEILLDSSFWVLEKLRKFSIDSSFWVLEKLRFKFLGVGKTKEILNRFKLLGVGKTKVIKAYMLRISNNFNCTMVFWIITI